MIEHIDGSALGLQQVESPVVDGDYGGAYDQRKPVTIVEKKSQQSEDDEMHLDHAVGLMDKERGKEHEDDGVEHTGGAPRGQQHDRGRGSHRETEADGRGQNPGTVPGGQRQQEDKEQTQATPNMIRSASR